MNPPLRTFATGATRDTDEGKLDYEGFLSPLVLERYARYMHACRVQSDGNLRDSDNWQKGIPRTEYARSLWRHFWAWWMLHRGHGVIDKKTGEPVTIENAVCAMLFNAMGYLHETLKGAR